MKYRVGCFRAELEEAFTLFDRVGDGQIDAQVDNKTNKDERTKIKTKMNKLNQLRKQQTNRRCVGDSPRDVQVNKRTTNQPTSKQTKKQINKQTN